MSRNYEVDVFVTLSEEDAANGVQLMQQALEEFTQKTCQFVADGTMRTDEDSRTVYACRDIPIILGWGKEEAEYTEEVAKVLWKALGGYRYVCVTVRFLDAPPPEEEFDYSEEDYEYIMKGDNDDSRN